MSKFKAAYQFDAQPSSGELSLSIGDILTVTRKDVGEGWWEGYNARGDYGLFPEAYVTPLIESPMGSDPPDMPLPPLPEGFGTPVQTKDEDVSPSVPSFPPNDTGTALPPHEPISSQQSYTTTGTSDDPDFADDWSDDPEGSDGMQVMENISSAYGTHNTGNHLPIPSGGRTGTHGGSVKRSLNRFSNFVKTGTEGYILDSVKVSQAVSFPIHVVFEAGVIRWLREFEGYTCRVDSPRKASKMKGLKSFMAYQLTPSFNNIQVSRRYKHFDWLHGRLVEKFAFLPVPPLPEKTLTGRYENELLEHRQNLLQIWVDKICRHPLMSNCEVFQHFITTTDDKKWKSGKRKAEKDEYIGGNLFLTVVVPADPIDPLDTERRLQNFATFAKNFDDAVKFGYANVLEHVKRMQGPMKKEYSKLGVTFRGICHAFQADSGMPSQEDSSLCEALRQTADSYDRVADLFDKQPKNDCEKLLNLFYTYKGMLSTIPDVQNIHKSATAKLKDHQKLSDEGKIGPSELESIRSKVDVISYSLMAEVRHFQDERILDFKTETKNFLQEQIKFYQNIVQSLQTAADLL